MYTNFRAAWLSLAFAGVTSLLAAQSSQSEDLQRADKQYDLYAYNLALKTYEEVLKIQPNNAHALARTGDSYFQLNRPEDALPWYEKAVKRQDVEPEALLHYGKALLQTGDYVGARKWFLRYAETNPVVGNHYAGLTNYAAQTAKKEGLYTVKNEALNTVAADFSPAFYGNRIAYSSSRTDIQRQTQSKTSSDWSGAAYNQLYVTQRNPEGTYLQKPQFLRSDLQNAYNEGPVSFSADGRKVAFCRNNFIDGTRQIAEKGLNMSLYTADVEDGNWVNIKAFPYNGSDFSTGFPTLSPNGKMLLFASNQPGGFGGWDIYVSNLVSETWMTPRNVGTPLNTPGNEVTPFYDGTNLYFSSDWHNGLGGLDIFRAELGDESVANVYHLGPVINSSYDDYGFVYSDDQRMGYLTSNRPGGRGHEDIWQATKVRQSTPPAEVVTVPASSLPAATPTQYSTPTNTQPAPSPTQYSTTTYSTPEPGLLYMQVTDEFSNVLPGARLDFTNCGLGTGLTDINGKFFFRPLTYAVDCSVEIAKDGYQETTVGLTGFGQRNVMLAMGHDKRQEFIGSIVDRQSKALLPEVVVEVSYGGRTIQTATDYKGAYSLMLEPGVNYNLTYQRNGYNSVTIKTRPGTTGMAIQQVQLDRIADLVAADRPTQYSTTTSTNPTPTTSTKPTPTTELLSAARPVPPPVPLQPFNGYSIQLAATPDDLNSALLNKLEELSKYGNLYAKNEDNVNKVRLGIYPTKTEAQEKLKQIQKKAAFKSAFVVEERGADESLVIGPPTTPATPVQYSTKGTPSTDNSQVRYAVQLGSFSAEKPIAIGEYTSLASLGNIYTKAENGMNKVRLGVWSQHGSADIAKSEAVARGFKDAIVVTEKADDQSLQAFMISKPATPTQYSTTTEKRSTTSKGTEPARPTTYSTPTTGPVYYYIRVAALSNPERLDRDKLAGLGNIELRKGDKGMMILLLGAFADLESVTSVLNQARSRGFEEAYVVRDEAGKLVRVK